MKFIFILYFILFSPQMVIARTCCKNHRGISNCVNGKFVCSDGTYSDCHCQNKILEKRVVPDIDISTIAKLKNKLKKRFNKK